MILDHLRRLLRSERVVTTDLCSVDVDCPGEDIQALSFPDDAYADRLFATTCSSTYQRPGSGNCARVLVPGGTAVFDGPGDFRKETTINFVRPDSNGHYRHYGKDLLKKLQPFFRTVTAVDMSVERIPAWHVRKYDVAFVCVR